jgi:hypothetical protein
MECPKCGLINPETAQRCDCGWNFETKQFSAPISLVEIRDPGRFESGHSLAVGVTVGLSLVMLLSLISVGSKYLQLRLISDVAAGMSITTEVAEASDNRHQFIAGLQAVAYIVASILFLIWFHRAYKNLRPLGAVNLTYSPGWAVGGFFVPFLNLVRPFQVMREIWKASDPKGIAWQ